MFINPAVTTMKLNKIENDMITQEIIKKKEGGKNEITLKYIIENKPKNKIVRNFIKSKCDVIVDEEDKIFNDEI